MMFSIRYAISALVLTLLAQASGCRTPQRVTLDNIEWQNETILCSGRSNSIRPNVTKTDFHTGVAKVMGFRFYIKIKSEKQSTMPDREEVDIDTLTAQIKAQDFNLERPEVVVGSDLRVGSTFTFQNGTWKILKMGLYGINVRGDEICRSGFIYIKQIQP